MTGSSGARFIRLRAAVIGVWTTLGLVTVICMGLRLTYPYALEWMEGSQ